MAKRILIAAVIAAVVSAVIGGVWQIVGLRGSPGPVFGVVFAAIFVFAVLRKPA